MYEVNVEVWSLFFDFFSFKPSVEFMLAIQFKSICTTNTIGNTIDLKQIQLTTLVIQLNDLAILSVMQFKLYYQVNSIQIILEVLSVIQSMIVLPSQVWTSKANDTFGNTIVNCITKSFFFLLNTSFLSNTILDCITSSTWIVFDLLINLKLTNLIINLRNK